FLARCGMEGSRSNPRDLLRQCICARCARGSGGERESCAGVVLQPGNCAGTLDGRCQRAPSLATAQNERFGIASVLSFKLTHAATSIRPRTVGTVRDPRTEIAIPSTSTVRHGKCLCAG